MIKKITITNHNGDVMEYLIEGVQQDNPSGLIITNITGLGPAKAQINFTNLATADGGQYNSSRLESRNIVITALFTHATSIEEARLLSYKYFPIKRKIKFRIETDNRIAETEGYVESNEPSIFEENSSCTISILCEKPYFVDASDGGTIDYSVSDLQKLFELPFEVEIDGEQSENIYLELTESEYRELNPAGEATLIERKYYYGKYYDVMTPGWYKDTVNNELKYYTDEQTNVVYDLMLDMPGYVFIYPNDPESSVSTEKETTFIIGKITFNSNVVKIKSSTNIYIPDDLECLIVDSTTNEIVGRSKIYYYNDGYHVDPTTYVYHIIPGREYYIKLFMPNGQALMRGMATTFMNVDMNALLTEVYDYGIEFGDIQIARNTDVTYTGELDTGMTIILKAESRVRNITIYNVTTGEKMSIDTSKISPIVGSGEHMESGDEIRIVTINDRKSATILRGGKSYNILNTLDKNSDWLQLRPGLNTFAYTLDDGNILADFIVERVFEGV